MRRSLLALCLAGCSGGDAPADGDADSDSDSDTQSATDAPPPWDRGLPGTERLTTVRGRHVLRGIIHCHSVYSHDACDDENFIDGAPNEECLARFRQAICDTRQDFVMLTEHDVEMADFPFEDMFLLRDDDVALIDGGVPVASLVRCDEGPGTLLFPGAENELMPVMMTRHPDGDAAARHAAYDASDAAAADVFRETGALVLVPHAEHWSIDALRALAPDGMEIYNFHANVDPDIREEWLGLDGFGAFGAIAAYGLDDRLPHPDLAFLAFFEENATDLALWDAMLAERVIPGIVGTDVHENSVPGALSDGERGDSYRRLMKWMGNYLLADTADPTGIREALLRGRLFTAFHVLGVPHGFDFRIESGGLTLEMGEGGFMKPGAVAYIRVPEVLDLDESLPAPEIRTVLLRVGDGVRETIAEGTGDLDVPLSETGAYRVEIRMTPRHLEPYLNGYGPELIREMPWIYSGAIRLVNE